MGLNSSNNKEKRKEAVGSKAKTAVEKQVSDTKKKAHDAQYGKK